MPPAQPLRNTPGLVGLEGGSRRVNNNARLPDELREIVLHATDTADVLETSSTLHEATVTLLALTYASCESIETALGGLGGVVRDTIRVNVVTSKVTFQFDAAKLVESAIVQTFENIGYGVEDIYIEKTLAKRSGSAQIKASQATLRNSDKLHKATFELSGLTCSSCVAAIETALSKLDGVLRETVNVNLLMSTATLQFDASRIDEQAIKQTIENAGYNVEDVQVERVKVNLKRQTHLRNSPSKASLHRSHKENVTLHIATFKLSRLECAKCVTAVETALRGLNGVLHDTVSVNSSTSTATLQFDASKIDEQTIKRAIENSRHSEDDQGEKTRADLERQQHPRAKPSEANLRDSNVKSDKLHKATFELSGLTCASCVAAIETALRGLDGVLHNTVSVNLLMSTATLQFDASKIDEQAIKQTIENAGYNVDDVQVERVRVKNKRQRQLRAKPSEATLHSPDAESDKLHKAHFELSGITCASCVAAIETALRGLDGVLHDTVSVNLLMSTATLQFDASKIDEKAIKQTIENAGYGVDAVRVEKAHDKRQLRLRPSAMSLRSSSNLSDDDYSSTVASVKMVTTKLTISGFTDALWVSKIQDEINGVPGIESAQIDSVLGEATIRHDLNLVGPRDIIEKIQQLGCDAQLASAQPSKQNAIRERAKRHEQKLRWCFLLSFIAAVPTFIISMIIMMWLPKMNPVRMAFHYEIVPGLDITTLVLFVIATFVQFYLGAPFYVKAYRAMYYAHVANMETLVAIGTTCAYAGSTANVILAMAKKNTSDGQQFYETSIFLIMFILLGKWLEALAKGKTYETITKLMELQPEKATLVNFAHDKEHGEIETEREIDLALVQVGDILKVNAGARIPCDGKIYRGRTAVDESMITGESIPVSKTTGDEVISATVNATSTVWITATRVGSDTTLSRIITLVQEAQASKKAPIEVMADKISQYFVPVVILIAIVTFIVWISLGAAKAFPEHWIPEYSNYQVFALFFAIAVVSIACPCAMGLASPTAIMVGTGLAARYGILIKGGGEAIQMASRLTTVAFDKTGTLTHGKPKVVYADLQVWNAPEISDESRRLLLQIIGVVESSSDHPLARAIVEYSIAELRPNVEKKKTANENDDGTSVANSFSGVRLESITEVPGKGVQAVVTVNRSTDPAGLLPPPPEPSTATVGRAAYNVYIGSKRWVRKQNGHTFPAHVTKEDVKNTLKRWRGAGCSIVCVGLSRASLDIEESKEHAGLVVAQFGIADTARPDAAATVATLKSMSIDVWMITGDHPVTAKSVAMQLGIKNVLAQVTPGEKSDMVKWLQQRGAKRGTKHEARAVVAMMGDGINDSPALAQADLGISIANATDIAMESASVILTRSTLLSLITLLRLSKAIIKRIKINFFWAFIYNSLAIPIAAGVFFPVFGIGLPPPAAGLAMAFSSVSVVLSSLMLRRFKEWRTTQNL